MTLLVFSNREDVKIKKNELNFTGKFGGICKSISPLKPPHKNMDKIESDVQPVASSFKATLLKSTDAKLKNLRGPQTVSGKQVI